MLYMFGIGFLVNKYKNAPEVNISIDDSFIDSFTIEDGAGTDKIPLIPETHWLPYEQKEANPDFDTMLERLEKYILSNDLPNIEKLISFKNGKYSQRVYEYISQQATQDNDLVIRLEKNPVIKHWLRYKRDEPTIPKTFKIYTIQEEILRGKKEIIVTIKNDDNNYTNGFMTMSTTIDLRHVFLLPVSYLHFFLRQKEEFWKAMQKIIPDEFKGIGDVYLDGPQGYPYPNKITWNDEPTYSSDCLNIGGSGEFKVQLHRHRGLFMLDQDHQQPATVCGDMRKWFADQPVDSEVRLILDQGDDLPAFLFSRVFISLVNRGFLDKYIK